MGAKRQKNGDWQDEKRRRRTMHKDIDLGVSVCGSQAWGGDLNHRPKAGRNLHAMDVGG